MGENPKGRNSCQILGPILILLLRSAMNPNKILEYSEKRVLLVPIFIALNFVVFFLWKGAEANKNVSLDFMYENFLVSFDALESGKYWVLLSSVFSHNLGIHLFLNMFVLYSFGSLLERLLGRRKFFNFYILAGIVSSLSHSLVSAFMVGNPEIPALGASGAIAGLILVFSFVFPKEKILIMGLIPIPALWGAVLLIGLDIWGLLEQANGGGLPIGHGAHLGGAFFGIYYYFLFIRPKYRSISNFRQSGL